MVKTKDLIDSVSVRYGLSRPRAETLVRFIFDQMYNELCQGGEVVIRGFGAFRIVKRNPKRQGDLKTKKTIVLPARKSVKFVPSINMKREIK